MTEAVIDNPTYLEHIRHFFTDEDLDHMSQRGHDLSTYQGVRKDAVSVSQLTAPPDASMPPPETGRAWSAERNQSFVNWITNGFPIGTPTLQQPVYGPAPNTPNGLGASKSTRSTAGLPRDGADAGEIPVNNSKRRTRVRGIRAATRISRATVNAMIIPRNHQ